MILFIDCHDSFSYNLTRLISSSCPVDVEVTQHDQISRAELIEYLPLLDAIVLGPGPGDPHNPEDRGVVADVWDIVQNTPIPVLGICFGYQSLVLSFGGQVNRMDLPQHGRVGSIEHDGTSRLLKGIPSPFEAVRYHSLHAVSNSPLKCTAKDCKSTELPDEMAAEHAYLPFFGVQFHPESVLSTYGKQIFQNFWQVASEYNAKHRTLKRGSLPKQLLLTHDPLMQPQTAGAPVDLVIKEIAPVNTRDAHDLFGEVVVLKSAAFPGQWSIIGILEEGVTHHIRSKSGMVYEGPLRSANYKMKGSSEQSIWKTVAKFMETKLISQDFARSLNKKYGLPFLGGLVGYISYEGACEATVNNGAHVEGTVLNSDFSLVYITKSILINEKTGQTFAVGTKNWIDEVSTTSTNPILPNSESVGQFKLARLRTDDEATYSAKVEECFQSLRAGDSYELCLTAQAQLSLETAIDPWQLFNHMVERNPAPYSSYMAFDDVLVATSPERFMSWDYSKCEFRPIKGTIRKAPGVTREVAEELLRSDKERAENLMIVDLIRHDLGHLLNEVHTPQLMTVEEYHSVFQLVTSVEANFAKDDRDARRVTGIDVLSQSLPPGSMTGAPKQRSVEILRHLEMEPRGLYSGVHGYWSIDDRGDWSVIIRSLFQGKNDPAELWRLGAGGAITILSTPGDEFREMETKLDTVRTAFC